jgi:penicillin-binding protein 2
MLTKVVAPNKNKVYFFALTWIFTGLILYQTFSLQVVKGSQYFFDSKNSFSSFSIARAARGLIYDRNGVKLVDNQLKYTISVYRDETRSERFNKTIENLSKLFNENVLEKYEKEYNRVKDYKNISQIKLYSNKDYNPYVFQIEANPQNFPLVRVEEVTVRKYLYPELISHIVGYTGDITAEDYQTGNYNYGDEVGKFGVEKGYDDILRGKNGINRVDYYGSDGKQVLSSIQPKINGRDVYLTIDINYQQKLYDSIKKGFARKELSKAPSSAAIIQDVNTGQILAMASYPTFDANLFAQGISQSDYDKYLNDPGKPLSNKALQFAQPPGSTLKTLSDMVFLQTGTITADTKYSTGGIFEYGGVTFQDFGRVNHGDLNVVSALCLSSNIFHMKAAIRLDEISGGKGAQLIQEKAAEMDMLKPSRLKIGSEAVGYYPTPDDKKAKGQPWYQGFLLNASIGQGDVRMTPLDMASLSATLATKGIHREQTIVLDTSKQPEVKKLNVETRHFDTINEGMKCSAGRDNGFTGYDIKKYPQVSEKTGTAETGQMKDGQEVIHAWEITFTPSDKPEIAMSVFVENGGYGYYAGIISREFYKTWSTELRGR